jgi:hypothetical protein
MNYLLQKEANKVLVPLESNKKIGDKSSAICERCKKIVSMTYRYGDFITKDKTIPNVLQGYCDECGNVVSLPHQSISTIKKTT